MPSRAMANTIVVIFGLFAANWLAGAHALPRSPSQQEVLQLFGTASRGKPDVYEVRKLLAKAEIIPTVVDDFLPAFLLDASWSGKEHAALGNTLKPKKLKDAPTITLTPAPSKNGPRGAVTDPGRWCRPNMTYAIAMTDPDAPSRDDPEWSEFCHWVAAGLVAKNPKTATANDSDAGACATGFSFDISTVRDVIEYKPPGPPPKTGKHRYVILALAPINATTETLNLTKPDDRKHWGTGKERHGVRDWAEENGLFVVGANFIYAQNKKQ